MAAASRASKKAAFARPSTAAARKVRGGIPNGLTPNGLTLAGLGLGFLAALAAGKGLVDQALGMLALAAMADALAGLAAQGLKQATPIGAELDSLASLVVWGLAVALLAYAQGLRDLGGMGAAAAGLVMVSAAWRLCRGDGQNARERYEGLPLPAAGAVLASSVAVGVSGYALVGLAAVLVLAQLGPWTYPRLKSGLAWPSPVFISLGLAAFGWRPGWILPGLVAAAYAALAPFLVRARAARA